MKKKTLSVFVSAGLTYPLLPPPTPPFLILRSVRAYPSAPPSSFSRCLSRQRRGVERGGEGWGPVRGEAKPPACLSLGGVRFVYKNDFVNNILFNIVLI